MSLSRITLVALVVVTVLLGHDALMAADSHRVDVDHVLSLVDGHGFPESFIPDTGVEMSFSPLCPAPDTARTTPPSLMIDSPLVTGVLPVIAMNVVDTAKGILPGLVPPGQPPAVLRAFLQVFLN